MAQSRALLATAAMCGIAGLLALLALTTAGAAEVAAGSSVYGLSPSLGAGDHAPVNVVVLLVDDLGRGDIGPYGNTTVKTPNLDRLARRGTTFTQAYSAAPMCTPSRASLITGRYAVRSGMASSTSRVMRSPGQYGGLPHSEITLAEVFGNAGYRTALVGVKWHLGTGSNKEYLPLNHGFQYFYGLPATNVQACGGVHMYASRKFEDLTLLEHHVPLLRVLWARTSLVWIILAAVIAAAASFGVLSSRRAVLRAIMAYCALFLLAYWLMTHVTLLSQMACPLYRQNSVVEEPVHLETLTKRLTEEAERHIAETAQTKEPLFMLLSYAKVHTAMFTLPEHAGRSRHGTYGDNVEEMDWSVGRVLDALQANGVLDNTLVVFTSDHGPWLEREHEGGYQGYAKNHLGEPFELKGGKGQNGEGGIRVPFIVAGPLQGSHDDTGAAEVSAGGQPAGSWMVPAGKSSNEVVSQMDLLPTALDMTGQVITDGRIIDGRSLFPLMRLVERGGRAARGLDDLTGPHSSAGTSLSPPLQPGQNHEVLFHYCGEVITAARVGKYKVHWQSPEFDAGSNSCKTRFLCPCVGAGVVYHSPPLVYDLDSDPGERRAIDPRINKDVEAVVKRAEAEVAAHRARVAEVKNQLETLYVAPVTFYRNVCCDFPWSCRCTEGDTESSSTGGAEVAAEL